MVEKTKLIRIENKLCQSIEILIDGDMSISEKIRIMRNKFIELNSVCKQLDALALVNKTISLQYKEVVDRYDQVERMLEKKSR